MARGDDRFANVIAVENIMSAANTLTFKEIQTGVSLGAGIGILVDQIDYFIPGDEVDELLLTADSIELGWVIDDGLSVLNYSERRLIHKMEIAHSLVTSGVIQVVSPFVYQFFPPLIRATPRVFFAAKTLGFAGAGTFQSRMYFRYIDLNTQEYLELAESGLVLP